MAKKLKNTDYLFLSAYIRAKEKGMLDSEKAERMIGAKTAKDAAKVLEECGYGDMSSITVSDIGEKVNQKRAAVMKDLETVVPDRSILDIFRLKYDYHNLKTAIKAEAMGVDPISLISDAGRYGKDVFTDEYRKEDSAVFSETFKAALRDARDTLARTGDPQIADFILDNAFYKEYISLAESSGSKLLLEYARLMADSANLRSTVRAVRMKKGADFLERVLAEGGNVASSDITDAMRNGAPVSAVFTGELKAAAELGDAACGGGDITAFEKACDDALSKKIYDIGLMGYGVEILIAYLCNLENELLDVSIIMSGKLTGASTDTIRRRIRTLNT